MKAIIHRIGYDYDFDIQELEIPEDHIHMVNKGEPKISSQSCHAGYKKYLSERVFLVILGAKKVLLFGW